MPKTNEFCDYVVDLLSPLGEASYKFMFGGYGVYVDGRMIAIVADDRLLLRADGENRSDYEALGIGPFQPYEGKNHSMPFYTVPDEVMDDPDELVEWARKALAATLRMKAKTGKKAAGAKAQGASPGLAVQAAEPPPPGKVAQTLLHRLDRLAAVLFGDIPAPDIPPPTLYQEMREGRTTKGGASENYKIMGRVGRWIYRHLEGNAAEAALARKEVLNYFESERREGLLRGEQGANSPHAEMHYAAHLLAYFAGIEWKDREMKKAGLRWMEDFLATCAACAVGGKVFMPGFRVKSGAEPISPVRDLIYRAALGQNVRLASKQKADRFFLGAEVALRLRSLKALPEPESDRLPKLRARMVVERYEGGGFLATIDKIPVKGRSQEVVDWVLANGRGLEDFGRGWKQERPVVERPVRQRTESPV